MSSVPWPEARAVAHGVTPLPAADLPLAEAAGCVLAADLVARCDLPPTDTSAMDGWAVRGPGPWTVVGRSLPGQPPAPALADGEATLITTGAQPPPGATGILRWERAVEVGPAGARPPAVGPDAAVIATSPAGAAGTGADEPPSPPPLRRVDAEDGREVDLRDVRRRGEEARAGEVLVPAGRVVSPAVLGLAAAAGHDTLTVHRRPRVAVLVLGNELLDAGLPRDGRVRDALGVQLPAWVAAAGGVVTDVVRVADDAPATSHLLLDALTGADVVVTTGGSAAGAADHLRGALATVGGRVLVDTVAVRPGRPMLLADVPGHGRVVGLPGNPLAAVSGVVTLLLPLLAGLRGAPLPRGREVVVLDAVPSVGVHVLVPVVVDDADVARPTGHDTAAMLRGAAAADGLLVVPPEGLAPAAPAPLLPL